LPNWQTALLKIIEELFALDDNKFIAQESYSF
jgi:hypothetical protein